MAAPAIVQASATRMDHRRLGEQRPRLDSGKQRVQCRCRCSPSPAKTRGGVRCQLASVPASRPASRPPVAAAPALVLLPRCSVDESIVDIAGEQEER